MHASCAYRCSCKPNHRGGCAALLAIHLADPGRHAAYGGCATMGRRMESLEELRAMSRPVEGGVVPARRFALGGLRRGTIERATALPQQLRAPPRRELQGVYECRVSLRRRYGAWRRETGRADPDDYGTAGMEALARAE
ncbi:hypothetical protein C8R47DRAFT_1226787 [Mycena vitilis]|nr:hypothetical protein C8R47DRAFT_1226787 [Mycena vitilis]